MLDYYEKENWNRIVYTVDNLKIEKHKLRDMCDEYAELGTNPTGLSPVIHRIGKNLYHWSYGERNLIKVFDSVLQAKNAVLIAHRHDLYNNDNVQVFDDIADAEECLADLKL